MTLGSLFDGIGGWLLAARHAGVTPVWASEIEVFPCAVTQRHFPEVVQLGDITKLNGAEIEPVDIVCMGSPCQDLSVAGRQEGLKGERSGVFHRAVDVVRRMRAATGGRYPRFVVWENVPGAFSSNKGMDFRAVIQSLTKADIPMPRSGKWATAGMVRSPECDVAWRQLDAQFWGVPQRRKRIFLVADFGTAGRRADEILFERESVPGNNPQSGDQKEGTAAGIKGRAGETGRGFVAAGFKGGQGGKAGNIGYSIEKAACLSAKHSGVEPTILVYENHGQDSRIKGPLDKAPAINAQAGTGGNNLPLVQYCYAIVRWQTVRRLTPLECERLQGLPDGYTEGGNDTARYKALGNGMAQPCADWIIQRIKEVAQ